jgi:hypothetical protein
MPFLEPCRTQPKGDKIRILEQEFEGKSYDKV